jgi:hypothetical protein
MVQAALTFLGIALILWGGPYWVYSITEMRDAGFTPGHLVLWSVMLAVGLTVLVATWVS